jgi:hypothetical protein
MSRPEFLADHDLNEHIVDGVLRREPSVRFLRVREVGMSERPDDEVLEYSAREGLEGLIVVSHDVNAMPAAADARMAEGRTMAGLFMVHQRDPVGRTIDDLVLIWAATAAEEWQNHISFLPLR